MSHETERAMMTLKNTLFYLPMIVLLIVCSGCEAVSPFENLQSFRPRTTTQTEPRTLGDVVVSEGIDNEGCATNSVTRFADNDPVYVILEDATLPEGTRIFARLYRGNQAVEDTEELEADQDYSNVCVNFVFEPSASAEVWETGDYEVEFYVDGNSYRAVEFEIR